MCTSSQEQVVALGDGTGVRGGSDERERGEEEKVVERILNECLRVACKVQCLKKVINKIMLLGIELCFAFNEREE